MSKQNTTECLELQGLFPKPIITVFDEKQGSSDGGALLLKAADRKLDLIQSLSECLHDSRQPWKIDHELKELISQRVYAIACGYSDCNDASRLAGDPVHKLLAGRDPAKGKNLASQPTLSRFENSITNKDLYKMGTALMTSVIDRHKKRLKGKARLITIDLDPTDDPTHGNQQLTFFNTHYDSYCYLPMLGFISFNNESEQYLFAAVLRPGNVGAMAGAIGILSRVIAESRKAFPKARFLIRLDGGFASPEIFEYLESEGVEYTVNMAKNSILKKKAEKLMEKVRRLSKESEKTENLFGECLYAAGTWNRKRRIIIKAEVVRHPGRDPKDNPRFVVTNMKQTPKHIYRKVYCKRGDVENRIKELLYGLALDRTSCTSFKANQLRVLFSATAYVLMQEIRLAAQGTKAAKLQVMTIQNQLIKLGARVVSSVRRIVIHLPESFPYIESYRHIALGLGANTG